MAVVIESYVNHIDKNFDLIKDEAYAMVEKDYPKFMRVENTDRAFVKRSYMGSLGMPVPNRDLQRLPLDEPPQGPVSIFTPQTYRIGYQIERQTVEDELWGLLANRPMSMLRGSQLVMDIASANLLNNGIVLQTYDFGGTPLYSTTQAREDGGATWSNRIATDLPITVETVFQAIVDLLYNLKDSRGFPIAYQGSINIYVPSVSATLWRQAIEVARSVNNPGTSDNRINALLASDFNIQVIPLRFLTSPTAWFIGWQPSSNNYGLCLIIRTNPDISQLKQFNDNPDAFFSRLRQRFVPGYDNKRGTARIGA
jgi:hypothetical protein